jgi:hypothetical protein
MTIEQITEIAWAVVSELEPSQSFDVFDVTDSHIIFQSEHGLRRVYVACSNDKTLKAEIKRQLCE